MATNFVQIGCRAFQPAMIQSVYFDNTGDVWISFDRPSEDGDMHFRGPFALAFKEWWNKKAEVYNLKPEWFEGKDDDDKHPPVF